MSHSGADDEEYRGASHSWFIPKNVSNFRKHGIRFEQVVDVFNDPLAILEVEEEWIHGEERWRMIGAGEAGIIFVVYVDYENLHRIVSAREATDAEKQRYRDQA